MQVVRSRDAGKSWIPVRIPAPETPLTMRPNIPIVFGQTVLVPTLLEGFRDTNANFALYVSFDGGQTYHSGQRLDFAPLPDWGTQITASFWAARQGFVAAGTTLYRTHDAGEHWCATGTLPTEPVTTLNFVDAQTGWLLTNRALYRTTDGGQHWKAL